MREKGGETNKRGEGKKTPRGCLRVCEDQGEPRGVETVGGSKAALVVP